MVLVHFALVLWTAAMKRAVVIPNIIRPLAACSGYVANWRLILTDEAYFAAVASPSPLRHAWSLAVEEQYYLLFPLLLAGC